jgi:hypothetical protein
MIVSVQFDTAYSISKVASCDQDNRVSIPGRDSDFSVRLQVETRSAAHPEYSRMYPGVTRPRACICCRFRLQGASKIAVHSIMRISKLVTLIIILCQK